MTEKQRQGLMCGTANYGEAEILLRTLTSLQRQRIEEQARLKDRRCDNCGSSDLVSADQVQLGLGPVTVDLLCQECGTTHELPLSINEASAIGVVRIRDRPETTG